MKYYTILTIEYNNGTPKKKAIYEFDTEREAIASFHREMGKHLDDTTVAHVLCMAINSEGGIYKNEADTREVVEEEVSES